MAFDCPKALESVFSDRIVILGQNIVLESKQNANLKTESLQNASSENLEICKVSTNIFKKKSRLVDGQIVDLVN